MKHWQIAGALLAALVTAGPAWATNHAFADASVDGPCIAASGPASGYVNASASAETVDSDDPMFACFYYGGADIFSQANGVDGTLQASGGGVFLYRAPRADWSHSLVSTLTFLSDAPVTTVTFTIDGFAHADGIDGSLSMYEYFGLDLEGDLGHFSGGFALDAIGYGFDDIDYSTVTDTQSYSFTFTGPKAVVDLTFSGSGSYYDEARVSGSTLGKLSIAMDHGSFWAPDGMFGAVPEPATWAMMGLGFAVMGVGLRRRRAIAA